MIEPPVFFRKDGKLNRMTLEHVVILEAAENYVKFTRNSDYFMVRTTLDGALKLLPPNKFVQVHRSYAVALKAINVIEKDHVLIAAEVEVSVPITKIFYEALKKRIVIVEVKNDDGTGRGAE